MNDQDDDEIYAMSIIRAVRSNPTPTEGWLEKVIISMLHSYVESSKKEEEGCENSI